MPRNILLSWARSLAGNRLHLGVRIILHWVVACMLSMYASPYRVLDEMTSSEVAVNLGFAAFIIVFVAVIPSMYLYAIYRLVPPVNGKGSDNAG